MKTYSMQLIQTGRQLNRNWNHSADLLVLIFTTPKGISTSSSLH